MGGVGDVLGRQGENDCSCPLLSLFEEEGGNEVLMERCF